MKMHKSLTERQKTTRDIDASKFGKVESEERDNCGDATSNFDDLIHTAEHVDNIKIQRPQTLSATSNEHLAKKQVFANSCGAASLLCVAKELGIEKIPALIGSMSESLGCDTLELDNRCESDIYTITSGNGTQRRHHDNLMSAGYSMPDGIVTAGRLLGLKMTVEEAPNVFSKVLSWLYPEAKSRLPSMGCTVAHGPNALETGQAKIEAMAVTLVGLPVGLHWVVQRSDGSYMDPATGKNHKGFSELNAGAKQAGHGVLGYRQTGISIIASKDA
jgi:hypothetical protein